MSDFYRVITNVAEIKRLNQRLAEKLKGRFRYGETREVAYPAGRVTRRAFFESKSGSQVRAWVPRDDGEKLVNAFVSGEPGAKSSLLIEVQINFAAAKYTRFPAGVFVQDVSENVFIAHRGRLTKGRGALSREAVLREFAAQTVVARDGKGADMVILITALEAPDVDERLWLFADQAREVASRLAAEKGRRGVDRSRTSGPNGAKQAAKHPAFKLGEYFDEYAGKSHAKGHGGGQRTVEHGDIVRALKERIESRGHVRKSQAIDLALLLADTVHLYEVKTAADSTPVYTGVGQLLIHGEAVGELLGLDVQRFLVLPEQPRPRDRKHMASKAGIAIVTFQKGKDGYQFTDLP